MSMLYRSPLTRWFLAGVGLISGVIFAFGDGHKWRNTPSLNWLAGSHIPLQTWGVALIAYALLLLPEKTRPAGYALGAALFALFSISLLATVSDGGPKNVIAIAALIDCTVFHAYSVRTAWATRLDSAGAP